MADRFWVGGSGTWSASNTTNWSASSGGAGGASVPTASDSVFFDQTGTYNVSVVGSRNCLNLTVSAGIVGLSVPDNFSDINIYGSLSLIAATTVGNSPTTTINFRATTAGQTITTNGVVISSCTFNGAGGAWTLGSALTISSLRTTTLTAGTLNLSTFTLTTGFFSSSNSNTRSINFGTGNITLTGAGGTLWTTSTTTGLTTTGTQVVNVSYTGATATTITSGSLNEANSISFNFTAGTYALTHTAGSKRDLNFTGFLGTVSQSAQTIYGSVNMGASAIVYSGGSGVWTFAATTTGKTITQNSNPFAWPVTFNGVGGSWILQDACAMANSSTLTHTNGTLDLNGYTLTLSTAYTTATGTKNLTFNGGTLICPTASTTAFNNAAPTGFTTTAGTGTGTISMTGATAKTFVGGGSTYNCTLNQGGAGALTITGANTFDNITNTVQPASILFTAGTTTTFNNFSLSGTAGNLITIGSVTAGSQATLSDASGTVSVSYCAITDIAATGGATWNSYTTNGCVDNGNNTGWIFISGLTGITISQGLFIGNGVTFSPANYTPLLTLSQSGSVSSFAYTTTIPSSGVSAGDVAVILAQYRDSGTPADYTPTGWTKIGTALQPSGTYQVRINSYYKILTSGDIGATVQTSAANYSGPFKWTGSQTWIWNPSIPVSSVTVNNLNGSGSADAISYTITTNGVSGPLIALGQAAGQTDVVGQWLSWTGLSATQTFSRDDVTNTDPSRGAYTLVNGGSTAGADITASVTDIGIQELQTFYLTFSA